MSALLATMTLAAATFAGSTNGEQISPPKDSPTPWVWVTPVREELPCQATLHWARKVTLSVEPSPLEAVIRFDQPLSDEEIENFAKKVAPCTADLRWNDDSLVISPAPGNTVLLVPSENDVRVDFVAEQRPVTATPASNDEGDVIELGLAQASADIAAGYPGKGRHRLEQLAKAYPDNRQVLRALADVDAAEGRAASAAALYLALDADDPLARRTISEAGGRVLATAIYRDGKTFSQLEADLEGAIPLGGNVVAGMSVRHYRSTLETVSSEQGYLARVRSDLTIAEASVSLRAAPDILASLQLGTLVDNGGVGIGGRVAYGPGEKQARVFASYRMPDVSTAEQATFGGRISRIGIGATIRMTAELVAQADLSINGYGLATRGVRTRTTQIVAGLELLMLRRPFSVQLSYRLDAEYVDWLRRLPNNAYFIPLSNRENHTLQVVMSKPVRTAQLTLALGWTKDRYSGDGPTASLGTVIRLDDRWGLEAGGGISSISRPVVSGRQVFLRMSISRSLGGHGGA